MSSEKRYKFVVESRLKPEFLTKCCHTHSDHPYIAQCIVGYYMKCPFGKNTPSECKSVTLSDWKNIISEFS